MKIKKEKIKEVLEKMNSINENLENKVLGVIDSKDTLLRIVDGREDVEFFRDWIEELYVIYEEGNYPRGKLVKQWWVSADQFSRLGSDRDEEECLRNLARVICEDLGWL